MGNNTGAVTNPPKKDGAINVLERRKSRPRIAKNPLRTDFDGYVVVRIRSGPACTAFDCQMVSSPTWSI